MKRSHYLFVLPALLVIVMDQASKLVIVHSIGMYQSITILDGFFHLVHARNRGMAFGLFNRPEAGISFYFLVAATLVAIGLLFYWFTRLRNHEKGLTFGLALIMGGAIGNLIDRVRLGAVVDFLDFFIGSYHWPAFNLADSAITVGACWVAVNILFFNTDR